MPLALEAYREQRGRWVLERPIEGDGFDELVLLRLVAAGYDRLLEEVAL